MPFSNAGTSRNPGYNKRCFGEEGLELDSPPETYHILGFLPAFLNIRCSAISMHTAQYNVCVDKTITLKDPWRGAPKKGHGCKVWARCVVAGV